MRLSKKLKRDHGCGDFGKALDGYAEQAAALEQIVEAVAHIGVDFGYGRYELGKDDIKKAKALIANV